LGATAAINTGDTASLAVNAQRPYGFFAFPYGLSGFYTTVQLQGEMESGTLGTGWTSQANGSASGGNEAKCASGTASGNADTFTAAWGGQLPTAGVYDLFFRVKVTSIASTTQQMQLGLWDSVGITYIGNSTSIYAPSQLSTAYGWVKANSRIVTDGVLNGTTTVTSATANFSSVDTGKAFTAVGVPAGAVINGVTNATTITLNIAATVTASAVTLNIGAGFLITGTHVLSYRAVTTATTGTDFFFDEVVLVPRQLTTGVMGPQDLWQQFMYDRSVRLVRQ
jgi:hypothetical protein